MGYSIFLSLETCRPPRTPQNMSSRGVMTVLQALFPADPSAWNSAGQVEALHKHHGMGAEDAA